MNRSSGSTRTRLSNDDIKFYEENVARMLSIMDEVRGITLDVTNADLLELISRRLAYITEYAGQTRRSLIARRDDEQLGGES